MAYLMGCGHVANAHDSEGNPVCVICVGINEGAHVVERELEGTEGLEGRIAYCDEGGCRNFTESRWELPFFRYGGEDGDDGYYCGCRGWD